MRMSQHMVVLKGGAKWLFNNPPMVNIKMNPNANNIEGVNLIDPP